MKKTLRHFKGNASTFGPKRFGEFLKRFGVLGKGRILVKISVFFA